LISQLLGFKDWNTASAALRSKVNQPVLPVKIKTVGDMKRALEPFEDSDMIDADYDFKLGEFLDEMEPDAQPADIINQEFSLSLKRLNGNIVTFELKLEHESMTTYY